MHINRPFVTVSYAQSADGRIATVTGQSQWISGKDTLDFAHTLRRDNHAILVGIGTVISDDPLLTCRLTDPGPSPVRVIVDSSLRIPEESRIVKTASEFRSIVFCLNSVRLEKIRRLTALGLEVVPVVPDQEGKVDLPELLAHLIELGIETLYVEGGSGILTSFFRQEMVDRLYVVAAPMIIGEGIPAVGNLGVTELTQARRGHTVSIRQAGDDLIWEISFISTAAQVLNLTARALYFTRPQGVEIREEILDPRPGEVLVHTKVVGISHGTEGHFYRGSFPKGNPMDSLASLDRKMEYPLKYGYMNAGVTQEGAKVFAFFPHQDRFYYPEKDLINFSSQVSFEDMVLYPSVETAYNIILDTSPMPGEKILVVGMGMIGLLIVEILSRIQGLKLAALEIDGFRQDFCRRLGVQCISPAGVEGEELSCRVKVLLGGYSPDTVIHVSGTAEGLQGALDCAAFEGKIIEGSWYGSMPVNIYLGAGFHRRRLTLKSSQVSSIPGQLLPRWNHQRRTEEVIKWVETIGPSKYITHRYPLERGAEAFRDIESRREGLLQAVLIPAKIKEEK